VLGWEARGSEGRAGRVCPGLADDCSVCACSVCGTHGRPAAQLWAGPEQHAARSPARSRCLAPQQRGIGDVESCRLHLGC